MRYKAGHKDQARSRMLAGAARGFRRAGFAGVGVDALAREGEATSGAFYGHFRSKDEAFREVVETGIEEVRAAIETLQTERGEAWGQAFVEFYLGQKRRCDMSESCAMQSLSPDVTRASDEIRKTYEAAMQGVMAQIAQGLTGPGREARALALLSLLTGSVTLARAVTTPTLSDSIAAAARATALALLKG
jgi:AcrR family transcriptional regulator